MKVLIAGRKSSGTCDLSGKKNVEVWLVKAGSGEIQQVAQTELIKCLRLLTAVGTSAQSNDTEKRS